MGVGTKHAGAAPEPSVADMGGHGMLFCPLQHVSYSGEVAEKDRQFWWF